MHKIFDLRNEICDLIFISHGLELDNDGTSKYGYMKCLMKGTYVGMYISFFLRVDTDSN